MRNKITDAISHYENVPFEVPDSWVWCRLDDLFLFIRNGATISQIKGAKGLPITRIESISMGVLDRSRMGYANVDGNSYEQYYLCNRDILMSHINSPIHVGKSALCDNIAKDERIIHGMNLLCLRPVLNIEASYIHAYFKSDIFKTQIFPYIQNAVNQASINIKNLSSIMCPLPPLHMQTKITKRVADIMKILDELEENLL